MNKSLYLLALLSLALVGCGQKDDTRTLADKTKDAANTAVDKTKEVATDVKNAVSDKLTEWKLTPSDIKADLAKGGRIVRSKAKTAGEKIGTVADNARIVTVINAKYVGESDLSALKINVDADQGTVTLKGTVHSADLIGKAILLALDTDGVHEVVSLLTVETK
jgi:hyperosmotically inducible protein